MHLLGAAARIGGNDTSNFPHRLVLSALGALLMATAAFASGPGAETLAEKIVLTPQGGTAREDVEIQRWQERALQPAAKADVFERLGWAYVAKARRTLDAGYYKLAEQTADVMDARFGAGADSRLLRGHVLHNLHRFREAEVLARQLVQERSLPNDFALLSDVLMEQGKLAGAIEALQQMVNLKPGIEAYSRIAHLRWLKGDLAGAIDAMEQAVRAGSPRDAETYAWTLARLSGYYLQTGQAPRAVLVADSAIKAAPDYPPALLARGRALLAQNQAAEAVAALRRAAALNPLPEYQWWLADALRSTGAEDDAVKMERELKARGETSDPRTFALFLATRRIDAMAAVALTRDETANRADIFSQDALAWALAASGDYARAESVMQAALAEKTKDARLLLHAGEIALGRGQLAVAEAFFNEARPLSATLTPSERALLAGHPGGSAVARAN